MDWNRIQTERLTVITDLCAQAPNGSLGRTAVMKLCYFLQVLKGVPLGYHFTLYSYGPFDSDVLSDLGTAESMGAVQSSVEYYSGGYGYKIQKAASGDAVLADGAAFLKTHGESFRWVLSEFGSLNSANLELQSTIVFADREACRRQEKLKLPELARRVRDVKPHFSEQAILDNAHLLYTRGHLACSSPTPVTA